MALHRLANSSATATFFEIRLDRDVILLRGSPEEASSVSVKGTLVLCLSEPLSVKRIHLNLLGTCKISWLDTTTTSRLSLNRTIRDESGFYRQGWVFVDHTKSKSDILPVGNYEYPFEIVFPGDTKESVEGLEDAWVVYRMKATIERGRLAQNLYARKHLRIVRTLDPTSLESSQSTFVENAWPDRLAYTVSTASKAVVLGSPIHFEMKLIPLHKGMKIGKISVRVVELLDLSLTAKACHYPRDVVTTEIDVNEATEIVNEDGQEGWTVRGSLPLPTSLVQCMQDVDIMGIKIEHRVRFIIHLMNPDGHTSVVRVKIPIIVFISPNLALDDDNRITNSLPPGSVSTQLMDFTGAPPTYGEHELDQLWSDIDPSGYMTPAGGSSGVNTPSTRSRNASYENLVQLNATSPSSHANVPPQALLQRLSNIPDASASRHPPFRYGSRGSISNISTPLREEPVENELGSRTASMGHDYFSAHGTAETLFGRRSSNGSVGSLGSMSPEHLEYDPAALSKVPSYQTAVRTPAGTPVHHDLPNYEAATSTSPRLFA